MACIEEGVLLFGKYKIIKKVGEGNYAKVYLGVHTRLNAYRAIKCILKKDLLYEQLMREVNILRDVKHENIPIIYDIEEDEDSAYIIEEFCEGLSLKEYVSSGKLNNINSIMDFAIQICRLLEYLHSREERILYLDLKPDNLIISNQTIKLVDFGAAISEKEVGGNNRIYGSIAYSSPEQKCGKRIDVRSDIYSFGKVLLYMLDKLPKGKTNRQIKELTRIGARCVSVNPLFRYKDINSVKEAIEELKAGIKIERSKELGNSYSKMKICICECSSGLGAFELSIMIGMFLKGHMKTAYADLSEYGNYEELTSNLELVRNDKGGYEYEGLALYNSLEVIKEDGIVINYGNGIMECREGLWDWDMVICICSAKSWNIARAKKLLMYLNICEELRVIAVDGGSYNELGNILGNDSKVFLMPNLKDFDLEKDLSEDIRKEIEQIVAR